MVNWLGTKPNYPAGNCQFCGYNLHSIAGEVCPECGKSRLAWVEVECEDCHRIAVFSRDAAGKILQCPYCEGAVDVPIPRRSSRQPSDTIAKTRFSVVSFLLVFFLVSLSSLLVFELCFFAYLWAVGAKLTSTYLLIIPIGAALVLGALISIRSSYR